MFPQRLRTHKRCIKAVPLVAPRSPKMHQSCSSRGSTTAKKVSKLFPQRLRTRKKKHRSCSPRGSAPAENASRLFPRRLRICKNVSKLFPGRCSTTAKNASQLFPWVLSEGTKCIEAAASWVAQASKIHGRFAPNSSAPTKSASELLPHVCKHK